MNIQENYRMWCEDSYFDEAVKEELKGISEEEIEDRFYKDLEFGTGGLRGKIGAGTNRMNVYTVRKATQGLANYVIQKEKCENGVVIAYDCRNMSPEFAKEAALCLNANGIKTYLFESLRPTPELSFALRYLHGAAGIVITASHNPPEYNGYKVYWEDGAQITAPMDKEILTEVARIQNVKETKTMDVSKAIKQGLYQTIGKEIDDAYEAELIKLVIHPQCIKTAAKTLKIVYSPIHGTGNLPVQSVLKKLGFEQVFVVKEQESPDGAFPTVESPNPEDARAFTMALKLAKEVDADLVLATDPDADRLGVYAKDNNTGQYQCFTGNMSGILIGEYETAQKKALGTLPANGAWVRTIVTSKMADEITKKYHLKMIEVLTGFKYIGEQIKWMEENHTYQYVFGFEESYGCLVGTHARDKDAVAAVMALCEAAAFYQCQGLTLWDKMLKLYEEYGYYKEDLASITLGGIEGVAQINKLMENLRKNPVTELASHQVLNIRDYKNSTVMNLVTGKSQPTKLPVSDVIYYELSDQAWVCFRPSGTEPKIKFYCGVKGDSLEDATQKLNMLMQETAALVEGE